MVLKTNKVANKDDGPVTRDCKTCPFYLPDSCLSGADKSVNRSLAAMILMLLYWLITWKKLRSIMRSQLVIG